MRGRLASLRGWSVLAGFTALGWVFVASGRVLVGGVIITAGFVGAFALRWSGDEDTRPGALVLRSRALDLWFFATFAVNTLGATLLVTRHMEVIVLAIADVLLFAVGAWVVLDRPIRRALAR